MAEYLAHRSGSVLMMFARTPNLHLIKDVKAALHALRDVEQFLGHTDEQLDPGHAHMSGQWRCVFDGLETKLCDRKRCLKRAMFEALQS